MNASFGASTALKGAFIACGVRPTIVPSALGDGGTLHGAIARALDVARDRLFSKPRAGGR